MEPTHDSNNGTASKRLDLWGYLLISADHFSHFLDLWQNLSIKNLNY